MRLAFTIQRYNPEIDTSPHDEVYGLDISRGLTVLDALIRIKNEQDGRLTFRYSCRSAICGSCAMNINGGEKLACRTSVRREWEQHRDVTIRPLDNLPILKDLAVDMSSFWQKNRAIGPWLREGARLSERRSAETSQLGSAPGPRGQESVLAGSGREGAIGGCNEYSDRTGTTPVEIPDPAGFHNVDACIQCGACVAACNSHEADSAFLGPAALAKAYRFVADTREDESGRADRLLALQSSAGIWDCTRCNFCVQVCPKDVQPMEAIIRLRRASIERGLTQTEGARHVIGFRDLVAKSGRLNEAVMPLKVIGPNIPGLLHIMPLGLRMLWNGKVPNPLHPSIPGIEHVRAILHRPGPRRDVSHLRPKVAGDADG